MSEIVNEIKALSAHYPRRTMAAGDMARWLTDYAESLTEAGFDATDVRIACRNWRDGEASRMPTPGELLAYCRKVFRPENVRPAPALPAPRPISAQERAEVQAGLKALSATLRMPNLRDLARRHGETPTDQARRLWPKYEVAPRCE